MTLRRAALFVSGSGFGGALVGVSIGFVLGQFLPGYYRSVFKDGKDPLFDPVAVGIGQGLTQGLVGGLLIGLLLVAILTWHDVRGAHGDTLASLSALRKPLIVLAIPFVVLAAYICFHVYARGTMPDTPLRPGEDHSAAEHGLLQLYVLFVIIFVPLAAICFLTSTVMLIRRARQLRAARWALVPVSLFLLGTLVLLGLLISDFV